MSKPRILVIGDAILDLTVHGAIQRTAAEARIPVFSANDSFAASEARLGGAGAVAAMCAALGADVSLVSFLGHDDDSAKRIRRLAAQAGVDLTAATCKQHMTPTKVRYFVGDKYVFRADHETSPDRLAEMREHYYTVSTFARAMPADLIVVADYGKGTLNRCVYEGIASRGISWLADPGRSTEWYSVGSPAVLKLNSKDWLMHRGRCKGYTIITMGKDGMMEFPIGVPLTRENYIPARPTKEVDPLGAGDQVLATLAVCFAMQTPWERTLAATNIAASLQVERRGCVPVTWAEIETAFRPREPWAKGIADLHVHQKGKAELCPC